jgi:uncharacterized membrane protein
VGGIVRLIPVVFILFCCAAAIAGEVEQPKPAKAVSAPEPETMEKEFTGWQDFFWKSLRWGVLGALIQTLFYLAVAHLIKLTHTELYRAFIVGLLFGTVLFFLTLSHYYALSEKAKWNILISSCVAMLAIIPVYRTKIAEGMAFIIICGVEAAMGMVIFYRIFG